MDAILKLFQGCGVRISLRINKACSSANLKTPLALAKWGRKMKFSWWDLLN